MKEYSIAEVQSRHYAETTSTPHRLTYPTETTQQVNRTNHVNPPTKAEQPKLVNDSNQHQAEKHEA